MLVYINPTISVQAWLRPTVAICQLDFDVWMRSVDGGRGADGGRARTCRRATAFVALDGLDGRVALSPVGLVSPVTLQVLHVGSVLPVDVFHLFPLQDVFRRNRGGDGAK